AELLDAIWESSGACARSSTPNAARRVCNELQLCPLAVFRDQVPFCGRGKTTLGAKRQVFHGHKLLGFLDTLFENVGIFHLGNLGADESEHNRLPLRNEPERRKSSGALVIIFEQEPIDIERAKHFLRNRVVTSFRVPVAAIVPATKV